MVEIKKRVNGTPRRSTKDIDSEVLKLLIKLCESPKNSARWQELEVTIPKILDNEGKPLKDKKGQEILSIAPKVLSDSLKRLRQKGLVGMVAVNDEKGRPTIQYYPIVELSFGSFSEYWHEELDKIRIKLKKMKSHRLKVKMIDETLWRVVSGYRLALCSALWEVVTAPNDELGENKFLNVLSTLMSDPNDFALFLTLENKVEVKEILENYRNKVRKKLKLPVHAPQSKEERKRRR